MRLMGNLKIHGRFVGENLLHGLSPIEILLGNRWFPVTIFP